MKIRIIFIIALLSLPLSVYAADRPSARLAEGENCYTEPSPTSTETYKPTQPPTQPPTQHPTQPPTQPPTVIPPTPAPTIEESCEFYKVDIENSYENNLDIDNIIKRDEASQKLSCLSEQIKEAQELCTFDFLTKSKHFRDDSKDLTHFYKNRYDDCIAAVLTRNHYKIFVKIVGHYPFYEIEYNESTGYCSYPMSSQTQQAVFLHYYGTKYKDYYAGRSALCLSGYYYMDKNCNPIDYNLVENDKICGKSTLSYYFYSSPISLIWEPGYNLNTNVTFAAFKLNPSDGNAWTTWKASEKAPLLVYDPDETNFVKDASQLFGNWTFGGKRSASLTSSTATEAAAWRDGYEALGTLDRDANGKIDGSELNDLALWFDANRNGISEKGEVKRVKDLGITALYYNGAVKDSISKDLRLEIGYERVVDGRKVEGASIDWYGAGAPSKAALADYYSFVRKDGGVIREASKEVKEGAINSAHGKFTGTWEWFIDENANLPNGYLIFGEEPQSNKVNGFSFVEKRFSKSPKNALKSMVKFYDIQGETQVRNGAEIMIFELNDKNRKTKSVVTLSEDGQELHGTSYVLVAHGAEIANYTWVAKKVE